MEGFISLTSNGIIMRDKDVLYCYKHVKIDIIWQKTVMNLNLNRTVLICILFVKILGHLDVLF